MAEMTVGHDIVSTRDSQALLTKVPKYGLSESSEKILGTRKSASRPKTS